MSYEGKLGEGQVCLFVVVVVVLKLLSLPSVAIPWFIASPSVGSGTQCGLVERVLDPICFTVSTF